jgi:hypothetical protein
VTLEQKHDLLWPLACSVAAAIERYDETEMMGDTPTINTLLHMCRELKKAVDYISPDAPNG